MKEWNDDKELVSLIKGELYTAVVGDIMDKMGYTHQFLPPHIRPLRDDMFVAGRAMTVLEADVYDNQGTSGTNPVLKRSFGLMLEAVQCPARSPDGLLHTVQPMPFPAPVLSLSLSDL